MLKCRSAQVSLTDINHGNRRSQVRGRFHQLIRLKVDSFAKQTSEGSSEPFNFSHSSFLGMQSKVDPSLKSSSLQCENGLSSASLHMHSDVEVVRLQSLGSAHLPTREMLRNRSAEPCGQEYLNSLGVDNQLIHGPSQSPYDMAFFPHGSGSQAQGGAERCAERDPWAEMATLSNDNLFGTNCNSGQVTPSLTYSSSSEEQSPFATWATQGHTAASSACCKTLDVQILRYKRGAPSEHGVHPSVQTSAERAEEKGSRCQNHQPQ